MSAHRMEIVLEMKGRRPGQFTLARIAEYMQQFAVLAGGGGQLLFSEVREGSTCIAARPSGPGATSVVRKRIEKASRGGGSREACRAFLRLADMAEADGVPGRIMDGKLAIAHLPTNRPRFQPLRLHERGHLTGVLEGILRDGSSGVKARIRPQGARQVICTATASVAKKLGEMFLDDVRVFGPGWWERDSDGKWACESLHIESVDKLRPDSLASAVADIRRTQITWSDDPWDEFDSVAGEA